jgi:predicted TIM-barrel fold metal-dependent hydrolase
MKPASFTPEQLFAHCRPTGVSRIVLIQMSYYQFDNSYMLDMMKKFSGVFSGVGIVDENNHPLVKCANCIRIHPSSSTILPVLG